MRLTSLLDLIGMLLIVACGSVAVATFALWAGLGAAGLGVLGTSWLIDRRAKAVTA